jgi:hypothetical protein
MNKAITFYTVAIHAPPSLSITSYSTLETQSLCLLLATKVSKIMFKCIEI